MTAIHLSNIMHTAGLDNTQSLKNIYLSRTMKRPQMSLEATKWHVKFQNCFGGRQTPLREGGHPPLVLYPQQHAPMAHKLAFGQLGKCFAFNLGKHTGNAVNNAIINAKKSFTSTKLSQANQNSCSWYATAKQLSGVCPKKKIIALPNSWDLSREEIAVQINQHFSHICSLMPALDPVALPAYLLASRPPPAVRRSDMWTQLHQVKAHSTSGPDRIPNIILKLFMFEISIPACIILNSSLHSGIVPSQWKQATIIPVLKTVPTPSLDKLQPISLTSAINRFTRHSLHSG